MKNAIKFPASPCFWKSTSFFNNSFLYEQLKTFFCAGLLFLHCPQASTLPFPRRLHIPRAFYCLLCVVCVLIMAPIKAAPGSLGCEHRRRNNLQRWFSRKPFLEGLEIFPGHWQAIKSLVANIILQFMRRGAGARERRRRFPLHKKTVLIAATQIEFIARVESPVEEEMRMRACISCTRFARLIALRQIKQSVIGPFKSAQLDKLLQQKAWTWWISNVWYHYFGICYRKIILTEIYSSFVFSR